MQLYLAAAPAQVREASRFCRFLAHAAYRIGPGSALLRQELLLQTRGGLLALSDRDAPPIDAPEQLCGALVRECSRRAYSGVLLDFEDPSAPDRLALAGALGRALGQRRLFVPEACAQAAPGAAVLIGTALSGGSLRERLREAASAYGGAGRLALDAERLRMDFRLPCPSGLGTPLSGQALRQLMEQETPSVFFSPDLCARYFTYTRDGDFHFVLFDDADTLARKLRIAGSMGIGTAFFMWPEVRDIAGSLFR